MESVKTAGIPEKTLGVENSGARGETRVLKRQVAEAQALSRKLEEELTRAQAVSRRLEKQLVEAPVWYAKLEDRLANARTARLRAQPFAEEVEEPTVTVPSRYELGYHDPAVAGIQKRLQELGYYSGESGGLFDEETKKAVRLFQKSERLSTDGIVGRGTLERLFPEE